MNEKKKELVNDGPLLDFKKKFKNNNLASMKPQQKFTQKPMKKVTGRGR